MSNQPVLFPDRLLIDDVKALKKDIAKLKQKIAYYEDALWYIVNEADELNIAGDIAQAALDGTYINK